MTCAQSENHHQGGSGEIASAHIDRVAGSQSSNTRHGFQGGGRPRHCGGPDVGLFGQPHGLRAQNTAQPHNRRSDSGSDQPRVSSQTSSKTGPCNALLPLMVFQYKDWKRTAQQTRDEAIMCCVSSVSFLASLGIKSFPVHGLIATGKQARVIVAYQSIDTDNVRVLRSTKSEDF